MMVRKRVLCMLLASLLLLLPLSSGAETAPHAVFSDAAFVGAYGSTVTVRASVTASKDQNWILKTEGDDTLGSTRARGTNVTVSFTFSVPDSLPRKTLLLLYCEGEGDPLCEAPLFVDEPRNNGLKQVATDQRAVAITFDAATGAGKTLQLLDLLDRYGAKATFFVIGRYAVYNPDECRAIVAHGHELASHSFEHLEMRDASTRQIWRSLSEADTLLRSFNGDSVVHYRPPSGLSVFTDRAVARGLGAEVILWSIDSGDGFSYVSEFGVKTRVQSGLHNGGIVLMHVYGQHTLAALETLLPYYAEQGYRFVTVSELLLDGDAYIDDFGTQRALHHDDETVAPIAARLRDGR